MKTLLQQALEALEAMQMEARARNCGLKICDDAIAALRTAIAQAGQPVAWQKSILRAEEWGMAVVGWTECTESEYRNLQKPTRQLYTHPQAAKPLSEEQCNELIEQAECLEERHNVHGLIRAVEAAHNIKEQQP